MSTAPKITFGANAGASNYMYSLFHPEPVLSFPSPHPKAQSLATSIPILPTSTTTIRSYRDSLPPSLFLLLTTNTPDTSLPLAPGETQMPEAPSSLPCLSLLLSQESVTKSRGPDTQEPARLSSLLRSWALIAILLRKLHSAILAGGSLEA
jgi:hypothetical protein